MGIGEWWRANTAYKRHVPFEERYRRIGLTPPTRWERFLDFMGSLLTALLFLAFWGLVFWLLIDSPAGTGIHEPGLDYPGID